MVPSSRPDRRPRLLPGPRAVVTGMLALALAVVSTLVTASLVQRRAAPAVAIGLWPGNSLAQAGLAGTIAPDLSPDRLARATAAARRALMGEPGNPVAARALAIRASMAGQERAAIRAFHYSEAMSRRDLPTQLALIEWQVAQGDIAGTLRHYDRALRTTRSVPVLLSTMIDASADPAIRQQVIGLLQRRPFWRSAFLVQLIDEQTPPATVAGIVGALRLNPADPAERQVLAGAVGKLAGQGRVAEARRLLPRSATSLRNGGFEGDNPFPPLDWALAGDANLNAVVEAGPAPYGSVLFTEARNGRGGEVASQWLSLPPGRYRLTYAAGDVGGDGAGRPRWSVGCGPDRPIATATLPDAPATGRAFAFAFAVPAGCPAQQLALTLPAPVREGGARSWVDRVAVLVFR